MKRSLLAALLLLSIFSFHLSPLQACTNFLVGKNASTDGSTMISYAADSYGMYGFLHFAPAADWPEGAMREVKDWDTGRPLGSIPQPAHTYKVVGNMNEHQVTIGETTWGGREELWDTVGIDYGSLIYIALERSKTAREAIECIVSLVNEYGYASEGESFSVGDPDEIWIMDLIGRGAGNKGANWVAVRIPDNAVSAHANQARITTIPQLKSKLTKEQKRLEKKLNCKISYSPQGGLTSHSASALTGEAVEYWYASDLIAFARSKGYFSGADKDFNYQAAYNPFDFSGLFVCEARVWSFFRHFSSDMDRYFDYATGATFRATGGKDAGEPMPLWIIPERKVSVQDLKECMRDEYRGTPIDITQGIDAGPWNSKLRYGGLGFKLKNGVPDANQRSVRDGESGGTEDFNAAERQSVSEVAEREVQYWYSRPTATQQTAWSFVSQMRSYNQNGIFWFGVDDAACSCYVPMYSCINHVPECFAEGNGDSYTFSPTSAWWTFNIVANWAYTKYSRMYPHIREQQLAWDDKFNAQIAGVDAQAAALSDDDARAFLTNYSCAQAENVVADWQRLAIYLITKFLDGQERKEENGSFKRNPYGQSCGPNRLPLPEPFLHMVSKDVIHE
ncbi:MAG: C69 family dipeptidase [Paludibacteraceae bacterium]|nr:C69 family dipeptidase [Paludibacteraceae bacterium]